MTEPATFADAIDAAAAAHPARPAIWARGETITYAELIDTAHRTATALLDRGILPDDRVAILSQRSIAAYTGVIAALRAGCCYVPLNKRYPIARNRVMLERAGATALIIDAESAERFADLLADPPSCLTMVIAIDADLEPQRLSRVSFAGQREIAATAPRTRWPARTAADRCYIIFTSGSTSEPKGVPITNANMAAYRAAMHELVPITPDDRVIQLGDLAFDISVHGIMMALTRGAALYDVPEQATLLATRFVTEHDITVWMSMPSAVALAREAGLLEPGSMPSLRWSQIGGEALHSAVAQAWCEAAPSSVLYNLYGPTECTVVASAYRFDPREAHDDATPVVPIGHPLRGFQMEVFGLDQQRPVPDGEVGELWLAGPQLTRGYWQSPELDAWKFRTRNGTRWYRTGDLARRTERDGVHYVGRIDRQAKILGYRVELLEIEGALRVAVRRESVAVIAWPLGKDGTALGTVAFLAGPPVDSAAVLSALRAFLPPYMIPSRIIAVDALPLGGAGKIDYLELHKHPALRVRAGTARPGTRS